MAQFPVADCIRDIQDGRVYQKFIQHDPCARGKKALLIVVSTDGAPLIKSKKFKKPLICFLVELPPQERYKFENILLTGLWYGKSKPHVPLFSEHYTSKLFNMANGSNNVIMKHVNLCHQCAESNLLYHTCLPKPCF